jgi:hypothetical protein
MQSAKNLHIEVQGSRPLQNPIFRLNTRRRIPSPLAGSAHVFQLAWVERSVEVS